jgi:ABC-2 type transport system ATP-binding protein
MTIKIADVTKIYNRRKILDSINLEICDGEIMGFVGINGAGKTTTMKITAGVIFPTAGDVLVDDVSIVKHGKNAKFDIAWIPEVSLLDPLQHPISLFLEYGSYFGKPRAEIKEQAHELMKIVGLEGLLNKRIGQFSNGMKKRLMIAFSLFQDPRNFLLDETFTGLDPEGTRLIRENLIKLKSKGKAILLSTHVLNELNGLADKVAIIHNGKIVTVTKSDEIMGFSAFVVRCDGEESKVRTALEGFGSIIFTGKEYELHLSGKKPVSSWEIGKTLENSGLKVLSIERKDDTIERYFFEKIGKI